MPRPAADMSGRTVLITGASSGIGEAGAKALAAAGARVVMVARDAERGERALAHVHEAADNGGSAELLLADLSSQRQLRDLAAQALERYERLDVLVNNAGAFNGRRTLTEDGLETTFAVNHLAPFLLTNLLLDRLRASEPARIVTVSSGAHGGGTIAFDDLGGEGRYSGWRAYNQSKLANILFTVALARRLEGSGVTANCLHPGVVATNFGKRSGSTLLGIGVRLIRPGMRSAAKGAETLVYLASSPEVADVSGAYYQDCAPAPTTSEARDEAVAERLWAVSEELTGLDKAPG